MNIFIDGYNRVYSVKKWSFQHLFCLFVYFIIFALPFYFCFGGKNFWFDEQYAQFDTKYYFTGYYAVQVNYLNAAGTTSTQEIAVIPSSIINTLKSLSVSVDDSTTTSSFTFTLSNFNFEIISANFILYYDVEVASLNRIVSAGYAFSISTNFVTASASSPLKLQVSSPFNALTSSSAPTINRPAYFDANYRSPNSFQDLISAHLENTNKLQTPLIMQSSSQYPNPSSVPSRTITLNLLKDSKIVMPYYPSILETFKLKFSSYFGMLLLSYLIFKQLLLLLIKDEALQCHQRDEIPINAILTKRV